MVGAGLGQRKFAPAPGVLVHFLEYLAPLGIGRCHHVAVHVAAGRNRVQQDFVHALNERLGIPLEDPVELKGLPGGQPERRGSQFVSEFVQHQPLGRGGASPGKPDPEHESERLFFAGLVQGFALVAVVLHVQPVELCELVAFIGNVAGCRVRHVFGQFAAQMFRRQFDPLIGHQRLRLFSFLAHTFSRVCRNSASRILHQPGRFLYPNPAPKSLKSFFMTQKSASGRPDALFQRFRFLGGISSASRNGRTRRRGGPRVQTCGHRSNPAGPAGGWPATGTGGSCRSMRAPR